MLYKTFVISFTCSLFFYAKIALTAKNDTSFVIGSIGDSITTATNAKHWGNMKSSNWSTGTLTTTGVESHFHKLSKILSKEIKAINVAQAGATSNDLDEQVTELIKSNPDYVTILMGGNDVCSWPNEHQGHLERFENKVDKTLQTLISHNPEINILLVPLPDMYHLWELGSNDSCQWIWDFFGVCSSLLSSSSSKEERLKFKNRLDDLNQTLGKLHKKYPSHVKYDIALAQYKFKKEDISKKDCFHPSLIGQNKISQLTWEESWFSDHIVDN